MLTDLVLRAEVSEFGRLLDLACGTGQLAFPLRRCFCEVWAVDQEPDMVEVVRAKADAVGAGDVRPIVSVLGDHAAAFDADLAARLGPHSDGGAFTETVSFAYDLARKPA